VAGGTYLGNGVPFLGVPHVRATSFVMRSAQITDGVVTRRRGRRLVLPILCGFLSLVFSFAAPAQVCIGDCNGDGRVTASEILLVAESACPAADINGDSQTSDDEIAAAIHSLFAGCRPPLPDAWEEAFDASDIGWMMSGWGPGDGSLWVVGGRESGGVILHYDSDGWRQIDPGFPVPLLNWVHGTSAANVFVGGLDGQMLHFDGRSWTAQETPVTTPVWGIWAVAPGDAWAVGGNNQVRGTPFVLHYDGAQWSLAPIPVLQRPGVYAFFKVWGSGPNDIYTIGQNGAILHWDGESFTEQGAGISQDLIGIWGTGPNDITVVGGRGTAELAHFDGTQWQHAPPSPLPGLNGVWTRRSDVAHAVGVGGTVVRVDPRTLEVLEKVPVPTTFDLHSVFGDASGQMLAFGANFDFPEQGVVLIRRLADGD
jgi:hypothetical protein